MFCLIAGLCLKVNNAEPRVSDPKYVVCQHWLYADAPFRNLQWTSGKPLRERERKAVSRDGQRVSVVTRAGVTSDDAKDSGAAACE